MKIQHLLLVILLIGLSISNTYAQQRIIIQKSGLQPRIFNQLDSALANLQRGDVLYIPGGVFPINVDINIPGVIIYGAGAHPDSTRATYHTQIPRVVINAPDVAISGIYFSDKIELNAPDCKISYCYIGNRINFTDLASNCIISTCVIGGVGQFSGLMNPIALYGAGIDKVTISGNVNNGRVDQFGPGDILFHNNYFAFVGTGSTPAVTPRTLNNIHSASFARNIFAISGTKLDDLWKLKGSSSSNLIFNRCSFHITTDTLPSFYEDGTAIFNNCYGEVSFVQGSYPNRRFDFSHNYQLPSGNPFIGPYAGGFKGGAVPDNPRISTSEISDTLTMDSKLRIKMHVIAQ